MITHRTVAANGVDLHVAECGPVDGELCLMLHGFPEYWGAWRHHMVALAERGYRVVAPDQRGYGTSAKPPKVRDYSLDLLAKDAVAVIAACGREQAFVVGHDWGGVVAWWLLTNHPERIKRCSILNVPHPIAMRSTLMRSVRQLRKSWYMFFFQLPGLPERGFAAGNCEPMARRLLATARPGAFSDTDVEQMVQAWREPGALTGMINWYRAALRAQPKIPKDLTIDVPLMLIWGEKDAFLGADMIEPSMRHVTHGRVERFPDATHWVLHEERERVVELLDAWFSPSPRSPIPAA